MDLGLVLGVAALMVYRKLYLQFPFFFVYLFAVVFGEIIRRAFLRPPALHYFYVYWIVEAVTVFLAFLVLYEVFLLRLFPGFTITPIYRYLFPIAGLMVLALTAILFATAPTGPEKLAVIVGEFALALSFLQVSVLVFFLVLLLFMSRELNRHDFGIAAGFGIYASVKLIITAIHAGRSYVPKTVDQLPTIAYAIAVLVWLFYLSRTDPEPPEEVITPEMAQDIDRVHQELRHLLRKKPNR